MDMDYFTVSYTFTFTNYIYKFLSSIYLKHNLKFSLLYFLYYAQYKNPYTTLLMCILKL